MTKSEILNENNFYQDVSKKLISREIEDENLGPMGASVIEIWRLGDGSIMKHTVSMGGQCFEVIES